MGLWRADITADWLRSFAPPPLVVTCLNVFDEFIKEACAEAGAENIQFNIGLHCDREKRFFEVRDQVKHALDEGRDVVLHCQSGIRRAPLSFICMLMHLAPKSFEQSKQVCEQIRSRARLNEILTPRWHYRKHHYSENHTLWMPLWAKTARVTHCCRLVPALPSVRKITIEEPASSSCGLSKEQLEERSAELKQRPRSSKTLAQSSRIQEPRSASASRPSVLEDGGVSEGTPRSKMAEPLMLCHAEPSKHPHMRQRSCSRSL